MITVELLSGALIVSRLPTLISAPEAASAYARNSRRLAPAG